MSSGNPEPTSRPERRRKNLSVRYGALLLAIVIAAVAWFVPLLPLDDDELTVTYARGGAVLESADGTRTELIEGSTVQAGDRVVTSQGATVSFAAVDGHRLTLTDSTTLEAEGSRRSLIGGRVRTEVGIESGEARVSGEGRARSSMEIGLPNGVAGVRGTEVSVSVADDEAGVSVHEGSVKLSKTPGRSTKLSPGEGAVLTATGAIVSALPIAPILRGLPEEDPIIREPETMVSWGPVFGAESYVMELALDSTFEAIEHFARTDTTSIEIPVLEIDQPLYMRVQAVTANGLRGTPSSTSTVRMAARWAQGLALREEGNVPGSIEEFQLALERFPESADLQRDLGWSFYLLGRHREARSHYERARELAPDDPEVLVELARINFWLGDYGEAEEIYRGVLEMQPDYADALWGLGDTYRVLGRRSEALDLVQRAIRIEPNHPYARGTLRELRGGG